MSTRQLDHMSERSGVPPLSGSVYQQLFLWLPSANTHSQVAYPQENNRAALTSAHVRSRPRDHIAQAQVGTAEQNNWACTNSTSCWWLLQIFLTSVRHWFNKKYKSMAEGSFYVVKHVRKWAMALNWWITVIVFGFWGFWALIGHDIIKHIWASHSLAALCLVFHLSESFGL